MADQPLRSRGSQLQDRIRRFTRVEKAFYGDCPNRDYPCCQYYFYADADSTSAK